MKPRHDPATAGTRSRQIAGATRLALCEFYPELMQPLVGVFGWERAADIVLEFIMPEDKSKPRHIKLRRVK